jgi:transketolase
MDMDLSDLKAFATEIRIAALECLAAFGSGHVGGVMSVVEALAVLYGGELNHDPRNPDWAERDRLVLSKGHAGPALYAALALRGYFSRGLLSTLNQNGTILPSHCDMTKTPGVDITAGSLGQGASAAAGLAYGARLRNQDSRVYVILGDGECNEGQVWESAMFAAQHNLANLTALVDNNKQQLDGYTKNVMGAEPLGDKFRACNWNVIDANGHDVAAIRGAIRAAKAETRRPTAIILDTIKGYGCAFAEGREINHSMTCSAEDVAAAIEIIRAAM